MDEKDKETDSHEDDVVFDEENPEIDAKESIKQIKAKLRASEEKAQEYLTGWQKAKADLVNLRKEDERRTQERLKYAEEALILDLLPVIDSFEMAFSNKETWEKLPEDWRKGVESIHTQLSDILTKYGAQIINPLGKPFNPQYHEAVSVEAVSAEADDNTIRQVIQKGFMMHEKIIRTAKVIVGEYKK